MVDIGDNEKVWVITAGEYSNKGISAIFCGPKDADLLALKAQHEVLAEQTTYRREGYVIVRIIYTYNSRLDPKHESHTIITKERLIDEQYEGAGGYGYSRVVTDDDPLLDQPPQDLHWKDGFVDWLITAHGFRELPYEEFNIWDW